MPNHQGNELLRTLLRGIRSAAGLRQQDLASRLGVPQSFVSKYESGERRLDFLEVREVCLACGRSFVSFVQELEQRMEADKDAT
jgi:transcriptional regulator with XRE-family HTH domain